MAVESVAKTGHLSKKKKKPVPGSAVDPYADAKPPFSSRGREARLLANPEQIPSFMPESRGVDLSRTTPYHGDMKSLIIRTGLAEIEQVLIETVSGILLYDGVMAYPTETYYGLGAVGLSRKGVRRIFRLKKREAGKQLPLIVSDLDMIERLAAAPPAVFYRLASEFWPGPLTLVLKAAPSFPEEFLGPGGTIAVRIPPVPWLRALVGEIGLPVTATSANLSGQREISDPAELIAHFNGKVDVIVDGGNTPGGMPSTIVDISGEKPRIIRKGAVPAATLEPFLGPIA